MKTLSALIKRNVKLFFKDKGLFFTSLITPMILLVLYATFLGNIYRDSFLSSIPKELQAVIDIPEKLVDGFVGGQLVSSILAVSCVTVSFCSNMLSVQDKATSTVRDLTISPVSPSLMALSYYLATLCSSVLICLGATAVCLGYVAAIGWYLSLADVLLLVLDVIVLVLFGTALSSLINFFLSTQGQISAVGSIVSSCYGFVCGAYMPISQFSEGLQTAISFLPGTYGTALVRNHALRGVFEEMEALGLPADLIKLTRDSVDCNLYFFDNAVPIGVMYLILALTIAALIGAFVLLHIARGRRGAKS